MAQRGDRDAIIALLDYRISEKLSLLVECTTDHRFIQGALKGLTAFREDIVAKDENI